MTSCLLKEYVLLIAESTKVMSGVLLFSDDIAGDIKLSNAVNTAFIR